LWKAILGGKRSVMPKLPFKFSYALKTPAERSEMQVLDWKPDSYFGTVARRRGRRTRGTGESPAEIHRQFLKPIGIFFLGTTKESTVGQTSFLISGVFRFLTKNSGLALTISNLHRLNQPDSTPLADFMR